VRMGYLSQQHLPPYCTAWRSGGDKGRGRGGPRGPRNATRDTSHGIWSRLGRGGEEVGQYVLWFWCLCVCVQVDIGFCRLFCMFVCSGTISTSEPTRHMSSAIFTVILIIMKVVEIKVNLEPGHGALFVLKALIYTYIYTHIHSPIHIHVHNSYACLRCGILLLCYRLLVTRALIYALS
jgi:hypothetical protein